jgi:ATP-dependent RNA helicase DDX47/RRP3
MKDIQSMLSNNVLTRILLTCRSGKAITFVTQYDVELYQRIEQLIGKRLPKFNAEEAEVMVFRERVEEASRQAKLELKDLEDRKRESKKRKKSGGDDLDDSEGFLGFRKRIKGDANGKRGGKRKGYRK